MKLYYISPIAVTLEAIIKVPLLSNSGQGIIPDTPNDNDYDYVAMPDFIYDDFTQL